MNPSYSIIRSLCFFLIKWFYHRKNSVYRHVLSDKRLCNVLCYQTEGYAMFFFCYQTKGYAMFFLLSDKKLCNGILLSNKRLYNVVVWVGRQKAMKCVFFHQRVTYVYTFRDFVIRQKAIQCCCLGWQTKGYEMGFFSPASNICIYIYYIFIIYR